MTDHVHFPRRAAARWRHALAALALLPLSAFAFVSPSPPPGFSGSPGSWTFTPPSPAEQVGKIMRGPGPSVGGATARGAFRIGPGAARALAGAGARALIPGVGLVLTVAWLASNCYEKQGGQWVRTCFADAVPSDGYEYSPNNADPWFPNRKGACDRAVVLQSQAAGYTNYTAWSGEVIVSGADTGNCLVRAKSPGGDPFSTVWQIRRRSSTCPVGWYMTPAGCIQQPQPQPVTVEQIEEDMATKPLPQTLPPGFPYPLDPTAPFIFEPDTANPPNAQPLRVPQGNPIPIPNTNPQQYRQPVTRFTPAPTTEDPFRLDVRPEEITGTDPKGMETPQPVTTGSPAGKEPDKFDLCKEHPDIIACQKIDFDTPDGEIPKENRQITYAPENVLGGGSCPPPRDLAYGRQFSYATTCDALTTYVRPMVIAIAGWMAIVIIFSIGKPE